MARWFANNVSLIILAVILAFFVWAVASLQQDPILENAVSAPVVIIRQPLADQTISASTLPPTVTVRIRAPQSVFQSLGSAGVQVPVDLSQLGAGEHVINLAPTINASQFSLISSRPTTASVTIEEMVEATLPVRVNVVGEPAIGYQDLAPVVEPMQVTLRGTQNVVSQVVSLEAIVVVDNVRSSVEQIVRPQARTANGSTINNVVLSPEAVTVRVPIDRLSNYSDLAVRVRPTGQPANGYAITNISASPQVVTVFGPREAIQALPGFIDTLEVSVEGATQDVEQRVGLNVPPNVSLVSENLAVVVRVRVEPQPGARTVSRKPTIIGVAAPLTATISPPTVDIVLAGPLPRLNALVEDDVRVVLDATGLSAGIHQLTPTIVAPEGVTAQSVLPSSLQIELRDEQAPP